MKDTKLVLHRFDPAAADEEMWLLDRRSRAGWQLERCGALYQLYHRNDGAVFRHGMDWEEAGQDYGAFRRYTAMYGEMGWEYADRVGRCHIFRRPLLPGTPEEAYILPADPPDGREVVSFGSLLSLFASFGLAARFFVRPRAWLLPLAAAFLLPLTGDLLRRLRLRRTKPAPVRYKPHIWRYFWVLFLALMAAAVVSGAARESGNVTILRTDTSHQGSFTIRRPDWYGLDLWSSDPEGSAFFTLTDQDGSRAAAGMFEGRSARVSRFLPPGTYTLRFDWNAGAAPGDSLDPPDTYLAALGDHDGLLSRGRMLAVLLAYAALGGVWALCRYFPGRRREP